MEKLTRIMKDLGLLQKGDIMPGGNDNDIAMYPDLFEELFKVYGPVSKADSEEALKEEVSTFISYTNLNSVHARAFNIGDKIFSNVNYTYYGKIIKMEYDTYNELELTTDFKSAIFSELDVITLSELTIIINRLQKYLKHIQA